MHNKIVLLYISFPLIHQAPKCLRNSYSSYCIAKLKAMSYSPAPDNPIVSKSIVITTNYNNYVMYWGLMYPFGHFQIRDNVTRDSNFLRDSLKPGSDFHLKC